MKRYIFAVIMAVVVFSGQGFGAEKIPQDLKELWADYEKNYDKDNPLEVEILKTWEADGIVYHVVRFIVGTFRGKKSKLAGFYAYPKGGKNLPAVVQTNGGGQKAGLYGPTKWAKKGYACFNPNNGAQPWGQEAKGLPNTDWGALRPGLSGDTRNGKGILAPGPYTIDDVVSPRNQQWHPRVIGARRAITFLQGRPEVDPNRIGIRGHSTGGVMTVRECIDPRVKAAVPSVGGTGFWFEEMKYIEGNTRGTEGMEDEQLELYMRSMSCDAHWRAMHAPVLFLGASDDFNSPTINVVKAVNAAPVKDKRYVFAINYNHSFSADVGIADVMWFEDHLKGAFEYPETPKGELILKTDDGTPIFRVTPGDSKYKIKTVQIVYSYGRNPKQRFWVDAGAVQKGASWEGLCPVYYDDEPLFALANVIYSFNYSFVKGQPAEKIDLAVTSDYCYEWPEALQAAGVRPVKENLRMIDDFSNGLRDWLGTLDKDHGWEISTRKLADPRWMGPKGGFLTLDVDSPEDGAMLGLSIKRAFRGQNSGEFVYYCFADVPKKGWNTIQMKPSDFVNIYGEELDDWHKVIELSIQDPMSLASQKKSALPRAGKKAVSGVLPTETSSWKSSYYQDNSDAYAKDNIDDKKSMNRVKRFRDIRWEGGEYVPRPKFHEEG